MIEGQYPNLIPQPRLHLGFGGGAWLLCTSCPSPERCPSLTHKSHPFAFRVQGNLKSLHPKVHDLGEFPRPTSKRLKRLQPALPVLADLGFRA